MAEQKAANGLPRSWTELFLVWPVVLLVIFFCVWRALDGNIPEGGVAIAIALVVAMAAMVGTVFVEFNHNKQEGDRRARRMSGMRVSMASELCWHLENLLEFASVDYVARTAWHFCQFADTVLPMMAYEEYFADMPTEGETFCWPVMRGYDYSRRVLGRALRLREKENRSQVPTKEADIPLREWLADTEHGDQTMKDRYRMMLQVAKEAIPIIREALGPFPEGRAKLRELEERRDGRGEDG